MSDPNNPLPSFLQMIVAGFARHVLTGLAGGLAVSAGLSTSQQGELVQGGAAVVVFLAGVGWSMAQKKAVAQSNSPSPNFNP
jgi:hypothetical protein